MSRSAQKYHLSNPTPKEVMGTVPKTIFATNCMKCAALHRKMCLAMDPQMAGYKVVKILLLGIA